jgi:hypothetical protein
MAFNSCYLDVFVVSGQSGVSINISIHVIRGIRVCSSFHSFWHSISAVSLLLLIVYSSLHVSQLELLEFSLCFVVHLVSKLKLSFCMKMNVQGLEGSNFGLVFI